ncbi:MAG: glycosyltransferase family 4 protein [Cytophagales bacterium]|nr:glycosyltransferase family 4 protein [Cytophagales bacterium]
MKIVLVTNWYSENMGYSENILPKTLAHLGHDVHVISSTAQVYYHVGFYKQTYEPYLGPPIVEPGTKRVENYVLHRLPFHDTAGIVIQGLVEKVSEINPDIVQTFDIDFNVFLLARAQKQIGFQLFTEIHLHASVFPNYKNRSLAKRFKWYWKLGRYLSIINSHTVLCYPIAEDCADIARVIYHVPDEKIKVQSLGTDTQLFSPCRTALDFAERDKVRASLGFSSQDIVCIYTGRITKDKGPAILARAIDRLHKKGEHRFKALFVGIGEEAEMESIRSIQGCVLRDFVRTVELPGFYRAADIAVWPLQESTSQLDAIACGLPLIVNDSVTVRERVKGNGLFYKIGDADDLAAQLERMKEDAVRREMASSGVNNAVENFSWIKLARERIIDYENVN